MAITRLTTYDVDTRRELVRVGCSDCNGTATWDPTKVDVDAEIRQHKIDCPGGGR